MRRPVAHLIRNRPLPQRLQHRAVQESLRLFSSLWYLPILLMILVSAVHLIGAGEESQKALQNALLTTVLLIATVFLSTVMQHLFKPPATATPRLRPYKELLRSPWGATRWHVSPWPSPSSSCWGGSGACRCWSSPRATAWARAISDSLSSIGLILLVTWLLWVVLDTAIQEALKPSVGKRATRQPSTRVLTILPMLRKRDQNHPAGDLHHPLPWPTWASTSAPLLAGSRGGSAWPSASARNSLVQDVITGFVHSHRRHHRHRRLGGARFRACGHRGEPDHPHPAALRDGKGFVHSVPFGQIKAVTNQSRQFAYAFFSVGSSPTTATSIRPWT